MSRVRRHAVPHVFRLVAGTWWQLAPAEVACLWHALRTARWSLARELYAAVLLWDAQPYLLDGPFFLHETLSPRRLLDTIENLVQEGRLRRRQSAPIERRILAMVGKDGEWL